MDQNTNPDGLSKLQHMQAYCTISSQFVERSFHPKILFLASHDSMLVFISSANATSSGILSNQDLIGSFSSSDARSEIRPEIVSVYNYLRSFDGWSTSAADELNTLAEHFPLLLTTQPSSDVMTIPASESLLTQMSKRQSTRKGLKQINVFTPFLDPMLDAVLKVNQEFEVPVNVISPQKEFIAARSDSLPGDISFYKSSGNGKSTFHAKCYEFEYDEESILYWGSANCSFSGLISKKRNAEILVRSKTTKEYVYELWGSLDADQAQEVRYVDAKPEDTDGPKHPDVKLLSAAIEGDHIRIICQDPVTNGVIILQLINGAKEEVELQSKTITEHLIKCPKSNPIVVFIEYGGHPISNKLFLNHPSRIANRLENPGSSGDNNTTKTDSDGTIESVFGMFNVKSPPKSSHSAKPEGTYISRRFWTMPHYRQTLGFRSFDGVREFINRRAQAHRVRRDKENDDDGQGSKRSKQSSDHPRAVSDLSRMHRGAGRLMKGLYKYEAVESFKLIDLNRWFQGLDGLNQLLLEHLDETHFPRDYDKYHQLLYYLSSISAWMIDKDTSEIEGIEYSLDIIMNIQDLYLVLSIYKYLCPGRRKVSARETEILEIKRALYYRFIVSNKARDVQPSVDHREMILENFIDDLFLPRIAIEAKFILESKDLELLRDLPEVELVLWKDRQFLVLRQDKGKMILESIVPIKQESLPRLVASIYHEKNPSSFIKLCI
jgi:HKD family nuclease